MEADEESVELLGDGRRGFDAGGKTGFNSCSRFRALTVTDRGTKGLPFAAGGVCFGWGGGGGGVTLTTSEDLAVVAASLSESSSYGTRFVFGAGVWWPLVAKLTTVFLMLAATTPKRLTTGVA